MADDDVTPNISDVEVSTDDEGDGVDQSQGTDECAEEPMITKLYRTFVQSDAASVDDPEETPYKSRYAARKILKQIRGVLEADLSTGYNNSAEIAEAQKTHKDHLTIQLGAVFLQLGLNYCSCEENGEGERFLSHAYKTLSPYKQEARAVLMYILTCNQLGIVWCERLEYEKSLEYLQEGEKVHNVFITTGEGISTPPSGVHEIFLRTAEAAGRAFSEAYTHTLYYLAQVYAHLQQPDKAAQYCLATLKRQLSSQEYDHVDWATNCATLSQHYCTTGSYRQALHCLACASCLIRRGPPALYKCTRPKPGVDQKEELAHRTADLSRCWVKYAINVLVDSQASLKEEMDESAVGKEKPAKVETTANASSTEQTVVDADSDDEESRLHPIASLTVEGASEYEVKVPSSLVVNFEEARQLFLLGQQHIEVAKKYYTMDDHATGCVELLQDHSTLFLQLSKFETDRDRICKMNRRRADMLIGAADKLNPQYYLQIVRQLRYEGAEAIIAILDAKVEQAEGSSGQLAPHAIKKINSLIKQAFQQLEMFIDSVKDPQGKFPNLLTDDLIRPVLMAKLHMGRLYGKIISSDAKARGGNLRKSVAFYKEITNYCESHRKAADLFRDELGLIDEMLELIPRQLDKIATLHH